MSRLSRAPLFVQALALVVATALAAQLTTFAALLVVPMPHSAFTLDEVAGALKGEPPANDERVRLSVKIVDAPPAHWAKDDPLERRYRLTVAKLLATSPANIRVEQQIPVPGGHWILRANRPTLPDSQLPTRPFARGGGASFEDAAVAARLRDGRWVVVSDPAEWGGISVFLLIWLLASALVLAALAWMFTRRLVAPIRAFADTAEAAGRGDPDAVFEVAGPREVRKAARALAEMQRSIAGAVEERTNLIAAIAHDLRAPLMRLRFKAEALDPGQAGPIVRDIERMDAMIGGVLAFVRGEGGAVRERIDFAALVESAVDDAAQTGAAVAVSEAQAVEVKGDSLALRRLVANLIDNAVKYGGGARCSVVREGGKALLKVEDDGPGMADEALERMFTPFVRGGSARDPATGGVGLGLALARAIARAHGGDVWLERRAGGGLGAIVELEIAAQAGGESV